MQARRPVFLLCLAAAALLLSGGGCHDQHEASGNTNGSASEIRPADLKLDMAGAPESARRAPPQAATLGITLDGLEKRWNAAAAKHKTARVSAWKRQDVAAFQSWRASASLAPGVTLEVIGIGKDQVQTAQVAAAPMGPDKLGAAFNGWEALRKAVTPDISPEQLYKGLGLLSPPTARTRYMDEDGYVWRIQSSPLRPPPSARLTLSVHRARPEADPDKPFSMLVELGSAGKYGDMGAFGVEYAPESRGKTFEQAAALCEKRGLSLCSDARWHRACSQLESVSKLSTWTSSFDQDLAKLQTRGGASCDAGQSASAKDTDPKRGALCCTRNVAMTGTGSTAMKGLFAMPVLALEQALAEKDKAKVEQALAPTLEHFYTLENPSRADAAKLALDEAEKHPDRWSAHQSCELKTGDRQMRFILSCTDNAFEKDQGMATLDEYGVSENHIELVRRVKLLRKMGGI